ncbi:MAG: NAD(P)-dependent alcohol dehydrogenase [Bryobacteraceae bacterium]
MKAIVTTQYGPPEVLQLREIATPAPAVDQVLIKLYASSVNPLDSFMMRGPLFFLPRVGKLLKPKHRVIGADIAGRVESVGKDIKKFRPGDEVFGASFEGKGLGGFAEYVCTTEDRLALKPANLSFEEAAAVPVAAITALQGLRDQGQIERGQGVLIDGASGGVGTFAVQIAKSFGAEVTAVCSPGKVDKARSIGADHVIDYTREDFTRSGQRYDLILGANAHHSIFAYRRALRPNGIFVMVGGSMARILQAASLGPLLTRLGSKKIRFFIAKINTKDLVFLKDLLEARGIAPVIDRRYPLSEAAEALRYREAGHASGKVVIAIEPTGELQGRL